MQACVLNRQKMGGFAGWVYVGMPLARWSNKHATTLPLYLGGIDYVSIGINFGADECIASRLTFDD